MRESSGPVSRNERLPTNLCSKWERHGGLRYCRAPDHDSRCKEQLESFVVRGRPSNRTEKSSVEVNRLDVPCRKSHRRYKPDRRKALRFVTSQTKDDENADLRLGGSS